MITTVVEQLTISSLVVTICTIRFGFRKYNVVPSHCVWVFCMNFGIYSDYFPTLRQQCLLCGPV